MLKKTTLALLVAVTGLSACNFEAAKKASLPEGETNLSCAAVIYAATQLVADHKRIYKDNMTDYVAVTTKYTAAHAVAHEITGQQAFEEASLQARKMLGKFGVTNTIISDDMAIRRARACAGLPTDA